MILPVRFPEAPRPAHRFPSPAQPQPSTSVPPLPLTPSAAESATLRFNLRRRFTCVAFHVPTFVWTQRCPEDATVPTVYSRKVYLATITNCVSGRSLHRNTTMCLWSGLLAGENTFNAIHGCVSGPIILGLRFWNDWYSKR